MKKNEFFPKAKVTFAGAVTVGIVRVSPEEKADSSSFPCQITNGKDTVF